MDSNTSKPKDNSQASGNGTDQTTTELRLAGPVCLVTTGRQPVRLASAQAQAAVARLVMDRQGNGTTREQLADVIWPEGLPDTWASAMRSVVSRIRRFLAMSGVPGADLVSHGGRYYLQLPAAICVDVEQAEKELAQAGGMDLEDPARALRQAENAVRCFRRPFLANREGDWAAHVRQHLAGRANEALEIASRAALLANEIGAAISHSAELIDRAPLRESAYRSLMSASLAAGNRGDALSTYSALRRQLRDELGVDPSKETQQLYYEVLGSAPASAEAPPKAAPRRRPFIGRREALDKLDRAFKASQAGSVQLVLVTGELGIGKSRLLHEFGRHLSQLDLAVIPVHCQAYADRGCALASSFLDAADTAEPGSVHAGTRKRLGQIVADCFREPKPDRRAGNCGAELAELVLEVAASVPLVLILDDMDTADETTIEVLRRLIFHTVGRRVRLMVVAAATSPRSAATFMRHSHELPQPNSCNVAELEPFTPYEVHQLVTSLPSQGPEPRPGIGHLLDRSGGNPFLLTALLPDHGALAPADAGTSPLVIDYVHARTDGLEADSVAFLRYAAAYGTTFGFDVVAGAYGSSDTAARAVGNLVRCGLLLDDVDAGQAAEREGHCYRFRHGILREAIYAALSTAERFEIHTRLISILRGIQRDHPDGGVHELANQLLAKNRLGKEGQASRLMETAETCREAAAAAAQRGHTCEAIRLYRQALGLATRNDTRLRARTLTALGKLELAHSPADGIENLRDGTLLALQSGEMETALTGACDLADHLAKVPHLRGEAAALADLVAEDLSRLPVEFLESPAMGKVLGRFMARLSAWGTRRPPPALVKRAIEALGRQLAIAVAPECVAQRAALAHDLWQLASDADHPDGKLLAAEHGAATAAILGKPDDLAIWSGRLGAAVNGQREPELFGYLTDGLALMMQVTNGTAPHGLWSQHWHPDNRSVADAVGRTFPCLDKGPGPSRQLLIGRWLGAPFAGRESVPGTAHSQGLPGSRSYPANYRADDCLRDLLEGQLGTARLRLRGLLLEPLTSPDSDDAFHSLAVMAITAAELADPVAADRLFGLLSPLRNLAACHGIFSFAGPVSYHLARLARINQDLDLAQELATASIAGLSAMSARPWVALAQMELAATLQARGRPGERRFIEALLAESSRLTRYPGPTDAPTHAVPTAATMLAHTVPGGHTADLDAAPVVGMQQS